MTLQDICKHERAEMAIRRLFGYNQYDQHVWCWLVYQLDLWGKAHPIKVV